MVNTKLHIAPRGATLCAVYNAAAGEIEEALEARWASDQPMVDNDRYFVPLGVEGISRGDWESLRPEVQGIVRGHYDALKSGEVSSFDINLWGNCIDRAAPVHRAGDVLSVEPDEDRDFVVHVENPYNLAERVGTIEPHTPDATLAHIANEVRTRVAEQGDFVAGVFGWLEGCRELERESCPEWGEMSPYLEAMLLQGHPKVRLKNQGKFNPEGRRVVLMRVREAYGDGGWEPAVLDVSETARKQWASAGIPLPAELLQRFADRKVLGGRQPDLDPGTVVGEVQGLLIEERGILRALAERQEAYREAVVAICQERLVEVLDMGMGSAEGLPDFGRLKIGYVLVTEAIQQLSALPDVELDPGLVRRASLSGVLQPSWDDMNSALVACSALLDRMSALSEDKALRNLRELLGQLWEATREAEKCE